jgi:TolB-like protein
MKLLAELKRRNVIRMAGLYLVGAWLVVQVAGTILPMFGSPDWVARTVVILLAIGFIPALVISWVFELTPEGLKREDEIELGASIKPDTARRLDRMLIGVLVVALGYFAVDKFVLAPSRVAATQDSSASVSHAPASTTPSAPIATESKAIVRGVAVLPFDNLSPDPDNAYFAGGVYEEVLTKLSRMGELRVISRTSMERIAEEKLEVGAIGARLGVSHVLEGSVRKAGDQIRVTVQLIEAASDGHVWAENYDRKLEDVFAVQSEIALAIAEQLKLSLSPEQQANLSERPTQNQAAYALYLRALEEQRIGISVAATAPAMIDLLEPAVAADPGFLAARVLLAEAYGRMKFFNRDLDGRFAAKAREAVAAIVQRWPNHPQSRIAQGQALYNLDRDYAGAFGHFEAARAQLPNDVQLLSGIALCLKRLERHEAFLAAAQRWADIDPESLNSRMELVLALRFNQRLDEAVALIQRLHAQSPEHPIIREVLAQDKFARDGNIDVFLELAPDSREAMLVYFLKGDLDSLQRPRGPDSHEMLRAELLHVAGKEAAALTVLEPITQMVASMRAQLADPTLSAFDKAFLHAQVARWAALAGQPTVAREHLALALTAPPNVELALFYSSLSTVERRLGNAEAAWLLVEPYVGRFGSISHEELRAAKLFYDKVYGDSKRYQAYMAKLAEQKQ